MVDDTIPTTPHINSNATVPTTSSSTNVFVPPATVPSAASYLEWNGMVFLVVGIFVLFSASTRILEGIGKIHEFIERRKKRDKDQDAPMEARMKSLEETAKNFKHREELDREFQALSKRMEHEKNNRQTIQEGFDARLRNLAEAQQIDQVARTRLETKVESLSSNSEKLEAAVEKLQERIDDRFDRLHAAIISTRGAND